MRSYALVLLSLIFILGLGAIEASEPISFSNLSLDPIDPQWLKLLHYKKTFLGDWVSEIDRPEFFLSKEGRRSPELELKSLIQELSTRDGVLNLSCKFPARIQYLKLKYSIHLPDVPCAEFDPWKKTLAAKSIALVFSSSYANNPGSMFGHTFLRIKKNIPNQDLLDYGANYSALIDPNEYAFKYVTLGLLGGYIGRYSLSPYYVKVGEYSRSESRDLWEYELNLTQEQVDLIVAHLWELFRLAEFQYYFLLNNCSYEILTLIEIAKSEWDWSKHYHVYTLPVDTLKQVTQEKDAVRKVEFRPSNRRKLVAFWDQLNSNQQEKVEQLLSDHLEISDSLDPKVLEIYIQTLSYRQYRDEAKLDSHLHARLRQALLARSKQGMISVDSDSNLEMDQRSHPERAHSNQALGLYVFSPTHGPIDPGFHVSAWKHDLLNDEQGYPSFSQIIVGDAFMRYSDGSKKLILDSFKILDITSLHPYHTLDSQISWHVSLSGDSNKLGMQGGPGFAWNTDSHGVIYGLGLFRLEAGKDFENTLRGGPKLLLGWNQALGNQAHFLGEIFFQKLFFDSFERMLTYEVRLGASAHLSSQTEARILSQWNSQKSSIWQYTLLFDYLF